ncbi:MAG: hypothetical protein [Podoviridae sp. ctrTa16]|nr:MAG: hypothetical protein [Podoviridae sp. ctrTa16]
MVLLLTFVMTKMTISLPPFSLIYYCTTLFFLNKN